jgi:hypothetical protein
MHHVASHFLLSQFFSAQSFAQLDKNSASTKQFWLKTAYCSRFQSTDIKQFENLLSENLKFYHDKDGVSRANFFMT